MALGFAQFLAITESPLLNAENGAEGDMLCQRNRSWIWLKNVLSSTFWNDCVLKTTEQGTLLCFLFIPSGLFRVASMFGAYMSLFYLSVQGWMQTKMRFISKYIIQFD